MCAKLDAPNPTATALRARVHAACRPLLPAGSRVVIAVSGGPDSQALLDILAHGAAELALSSLHAVGVDHGLRAAARDELALAESLAESLGIAFTVRRVHVAESGNIMAAARQARYAALLAECEALAASRLAVGHTATDQAETILMRWATGSGPDSVGGMAARRGKLVRPLLAVTRAQLRAYLEAQHIAYASDPTNHDRTTVRARLRHEVLPVLRSINPEAERHMAATGALWRSDVKHLERLTRRQLAYCRDSHHRLRLGRLQQLRPGLRRRVLRAWLRDAGLRANRRKLATLAAIVARGQGRLSLHGGSVTAERGRLWQDAPRVFYIAAAARCMPIAPWPHAALKLTLVDIASWHENATEQLCERHTVAFDADKIHLTFYSSPATPAGKTSRQGADGNDDEASGMQHTDQPASALEDLDGCLWLRPWQPGDKFRPLGLDGHVKIGDLFTDKKIPTPLRSNWPVLVAGRRPQPQRPAASVSVSGTERVLWVVGLRRGDFAPLTAATKRVLVVRLDGSAPWRGD